MPPQHIPWDVYTKTKSAYILLVNVLKLDIKLHLLPLNKCRGIYYTIRGTTLKSMDKST